MSHHLYHTLRMMVLLLIATASSVALAAEEPTRVRLTTSAGVIEVELDAARAPRTVANFLDLVDSGFYDGLIFHRVVPGFVIQAGGYDSAMKRREPPRTVPNESANGLRNRRGTLAMARLEDPDSASSQFYVNVDDNDNLDPAGGRPGYTVFGKVVGGMDVVAQIELVETHVVDGAAGVPREPIVIQKAEHIR